MRLITLFTLASLMIAVTVASPAFGDNGVSNMKVSRLRCEYLDNPLGVDANPPRLSWIVESPVRAAKQTAYQLLVSASPAELESDKGGLWDSGKVASDESVLIAYAGTPLSSRQKCYWKVRVWDAQDQVSAWSETASWSTGLLIAEDWKGSYIAADPELKSNSPWLRKKFTLNALPTDARVYVNTLGYYELYINGQKVDDYLLAPAGTQLGARSYYLTHDVTRYLNKGDNCIALWLGSGWFTLGFKGLDKPSPFVKAQLEMIGVSGAEPTIIATGTDWKAKASPNVNTGTWYSGQFCGERYDARLDEPNWNLASYDDSQWPAAYAATVPAHTVAAQPVQPNRVHEQFNPKHITYLAPREYMLDFGTNLNGSVEVRFPKMIAGQTVEFEYGDQLDGTELESFNQVDTYIASGGEKESFRTRFNYHSFRYMRVRGLDAPLETRAVTASLVHTDYPINTSFACSNPLLTDIHNMLQYTLRCLSLGGNLVDCPHIERLGYGGDGQASTPTAMTMFGAGPMYTAWLSHWRDCQRPNGDMPHTAPNPYAAGGGPYWCGFIIAASWEMYQNYGDTRILETNYPAMTRWLEFVQSHTKDGLLQNWGDEEYRTWYLGDWARPGREEKKAEKSVVLVNNCFVVQCYDWMARIASILGKESEIDGFRAKADAVRKRLQEVYFDPKTNAYADDTQLDLAYPVLAGVTPEALKPAVLDRLAQKILVEAKGHMDVGLVGIPLLTESLFRNNRNDLVFEFLNKKDFPGYGYMLANGATTTWEHWDGERSHIHNCYNGVGVWFYRALAGIVPEIGIPAYRHFTVRPAPTGDVTWASARQDTMRGVIESAWKIADGKFVLDVTVPANSAATVEIPTSDPSGVRESGKTLSEVEGVSGKSHGEQSVIIEVGSGSYHFEAPYKK